MTEPQHVASDSQRRTPLLTLAAFTLLLLIPVLLIAGDVSISSKQVTIDIPFINLHEGNKPDIELHR